MRRNCGLLLAALCLAGIAAAAADQNVLVLLEDLNYKNTHSLFFTSLASHGYTLEYKSVSDGSIKVKDYDQWLYEKIVIFASDVSDFGGELDSAVLAAFVDEGNDLLLAVDSRASEEMRELAAEVGVDVEPRGSAVIDHFAFASNLGNDHTVVASSDAIASTAVLDGPLSAPVLFKGVGLTVSPDSTLVLKGLTAPDTALSAAPAKTEPAAGKAVVLVALVQARNNARVVVSGSIDLFSNKFFKAAVQTPTGVSASVSGNAEFATQVGRWCFHERGVLVASGLRHHLVETGESQPIYRINDKIVFALDIMLRDGQQLMPYKAEDVQVELVMMDPYVRTALTPDDKGVFSTDIHVPDVYGVFKFVVNYRRPGYSWIAIEEQVPIRPFRHNEYPRFLPCAYPYYAGAASMMAGFFALGVFVLYSK